MRILGLILMTANVLAGQELNVRDFGAVGDGAADATAPFQAALNQAGESGESVYAPPGKYRFAGHLTVPAGVTLRGSWRGVPSRETGTVLIPTEGRGQEDGPPFITLEGAAAIEGLVITYHEQVNLEPPPVPYPWTIRGLAQDCQVRNLLLVRPWQAVDFGTYPCSRHIIDGLFGSPLRRGIFVDQSIDVGRINNVHFSTFFFPFEGPLDQWKLQNAEAFIIGRADWEWITGCFALGYAVGFRFIEGRPGATKYDRSSHYVAIAHSGIDLSGRTMVVESTTGLTVSQSVFKGQSLDIEPTNDGEVKFSQCWFSPVPGTGSLVTARGRGRVSFADCTFEFWDTRGELRPALEAACASLLVTGCEFGTHNRPPYFVGERQKPQIHVAPDVASAVIRGNRLRYGAAIVNESAGEVDIGNNVSDEVDAHGAPRARARAVGPGGGRAVRAAGTLDGRQTRRGGAADRRDESQGAVNDLRGARVGDYRILYAVMDDRLIALADSVGQRKDIYRDLAKLDRAVDGSS